MNTEQCPGDCRLCNVVQRAYCATQIAYNTQQAIENLNNVLAKVVEKVEKINTLIEEQKDNPDKLIIPNKEREMKLEVFNTTPLPHSQTDN